MLTRMLTSLPQCRRRWQGSDRTQRKYSYPNRPWWAIYVANWRPACTVLLRHLLFLPLRLLERPFDYVSDDDDDKKGKSKVSRVCIRRGFLLIFVFVFVFGIRRSSLVVGRICLAFVSYFLGWFSAKIPSCLAIVYCSYCCCLLLFLLFLLFPLLQTISWYLPNQINCTLLFCFISLYDIWNLIGNVDVHPCGTCVWLHQPTVATLILSMILFFNS